MLDYSQPDLTQHPPRSPRARLGGFAHLPRLLDKARATLAGTNGLYGCGTPGRLMDGYFFDFTGIDVKAFLEAVKCGKTDCEMLDWVRERLCPRRAPFEIAQWSAWFETVGPASGANQVALGESINTFAPNRNDIATYCEYLELDDYVSFGGRA